MFPFKKILNYFSGNKDEMSERKILVAKRSIERNKSSSSVDTVQKNSPQYNLVSIQNKRKKELDEVGPPEKKFALKHDIEAPTTSVDNKLKNKYFSKLVYDQSGSKSYSSNRSKWNDFNKVGIGEGDGNIKKNRLNTKLEGNQQYFSLERNLKYHNKNLSHINIKNNLFSPKRDQFISKKNTTEHTSDVHLDSSSDFKNDENVNSHTKPKFNPSERLRFIRESLKLKKGVVTRPHTILPPDNDEKLNPTKEFLLNHNKNTSNSKNSGKFCLLSTNEEERREKDTEQILKDECWKNQRGESLIDVMNDLIFKKTEVEDKNICNVNISHTSNIFKSVNVPEDNNNEKSPKSTPITFIEKSKCDSSVQDSSYNESMDWEPITEENNMKDVYKIQTEKQPSTKSQPLSSNEYNKEDLIKKDLYIVIDTNIFISHLDVVKALMKFKIKGLKSSIIYVPYQTLNELDYIKDGRSNSKESVVLKNNVVKAIKFISYCMKNYKRRMQGQSVQDCLNDPIASANADDRILSCCLQVNKKGEVILLSNDTNLRNKALVSGINACESNDIFNFLKRFEINEDLYKEDPLVQEIRNKFSFLCSYILVKRLDDSCGNAWKKKIKKEPPFNLRDCLDIFKKFWNLIAITPSDSNLCTSGLHEQCRKLIEELYEFIDMNEKIVDVEDAKQFVGYCLEICLHLKNGFPCFKENIKNCTDSILDISKKLNLNKY